MDRLAVIVALLILPLLAGCGGSNQPQSGPAFPPPPPAGPPPPKPSLDVRTVRTFQTLGHAASGAVKRDMERT